MFGEQMFALWPSRDRGTRSFDQTSLARFLPVPRLVPYFSMVMCSDSSFLELEFQFLKFSQASGEVQRFHPKSSGPWLFSAGNNLHVRVSHLGAPCLNLISLKQQQLILTFVEARSLKSRKIHRTMLSWPGNPWLSFGLQLYDSDFVPIAVWPSCSVFAWPSSLCLFMRPKVILYLRSH